MDFVHGGKTKQFDFIENKKTKNNEKKKKNRKEAGIMVIIME